VYFIEWRRVIVILLLQKRLVGSVQLEQRLVVGLGWGFNAHTKTYGEN